MRLIRLLTVFLLMTGAAMAESRLVNAPGDGFLNLRTGPGSQFDIVMEMDHGTQLEVLEVAGNWGRVRHQSGAEGWAYLDYTKTFVMPARLFVFSPGDGYLNLRTGPGSQYSVIRRMNNGEWVELLERKGSWVRVYHEEGDEGWAFEKYLRE